MSRGWFVGFAIVAVCVLSAAAVPGTVLNLSGGGYKKDVLRNSELLKHGDPALWEEIDLSGNAIDEIDDNTFIGFEKLKKLSLASNSLPTIEDHWFRGTKLRSLDLSKNVLVAIRSDAFESLTDLRELNLANNLLRPFKHSTFDHTPHLIKLSLENSTRLQDMFLNVTIPSLEELNLKSCRISTIAGLHLENLPNLKAINLRRNLVEQLDDGAFVSNSKLKEVDLRENFLDAMRGSSLKTAFSPNCKAVVHFDLNTDICVDCKIHACTDDLELQQFLCQNPNATTFRGVHEWADPEKHIALTLTAHTQNTE